MYKAPLPMLFFYYCCPVNQRCYRQKVCKYTKNVICNNLEVRYILNIWGNNNRSKLMKAISQSLRHFTKVVLSEITIVNAYYLLSFKWFCLRHFEYWRYLFAATSIKTMDLLH